MKKLKFIDLFAGVGGLHVAAKKYGECVFAAEIDKYAVETYKKNYGLDAMCDITKKEAKDIPAHNLLLAGFPCQAFSKAGKRNGFYDTRGTLFFDVERIIKYHKPEYILLENVRNLVTHDDGNTYRVITDNLRNAGYVIPKDPLIISPHQFGVPQLRERIFIPGIRKDLIKSDDLELNFKLGKKGVSAHTLELENNVDKKYKISAYEKRVLTAWDEFYKGIKQKVIGFPIWAEFFNNKPSATMPKWKSDFVIKNNDLYNANKKFIDKWLLKYNNLEEFKPTDRKFEWQAGTDISSLWDGIIQFRPSGVRVKKPTEFPALVAMVHIPIIGWEKRRLTPREVANLQSFPKSFKLDNNDRQAYKQMGNSVNVKVIKEILNKLVEMG